MDLIEKKEKIHIQNFSCVIKCTCPNPISESHRPFVPTAICGWSSVLRLLPGRWFNDELINTVPALYPAPAECRIFVLSSFIYRHLKDGNFVRADAWVKNVPRNHARWAFGICEAS